MPDAESYTYEDAAQDLAIAIGEGGITDIDPSDEVWIGKVYDFMTGRSLAVGNATLQDVLQRMVDTDFDTFVQETTGENAGFFDRLIGGAVDFTIRAARGIGNAVVAGFRGLIEPFRRLFTAEGREEQEAETMAAFNQMVEAGIVDGDAIPYLESILKSNRWARFLVPVGTYLAVATGVIKTLFSTAGGDFQKRMLGVFTPNAPSVEQLIRHKYLGAIDPALLDRKFRDLGYNDEDRDLIVQSAIQSLPVDYLRILYLRGVLDIDETRAGLGKLGFNETRRDQIIGSWQVIPGVQDLLYMSGKEAFEPDIVSKYGYADEFPADQLPALAANGLSEEWALKYWYAHWDTPSISQGYEMLHRGVITPAELDDLFRTVEIPPFWRDKLRAISYAPYTRVDIRRMYKDGIVGEAEVKRTYLDLGYDDEHASNLTAWTIQDVGVENRETTRTQIANYYKSGFLDRQTALGYLQSIGYAEIDAALIIDAVDHDKISALEQKRVDLIGKMYRERQLERSTVQAELSALGVTSGEIGLLLEEWDFTIENDTRLPTMENLKNFLEAGVINLSTYESELRKLGYGDTYVRMYVDYATKTIARAASEVGQDIIDRFGNTYSIADIENGNFDPGSFR